MSEIAQKTEIALLRQLAKLTQLYGTIISDSDIPKENLEQANEIIRAAIEKLRPLTQRTLG